MVTIFTKEQTDAIYARNCDLLVSAAAGSGKTAVLVERIIQMVTDAEKPVDIDRLLVVTFTDAAALEMRQRIYKAVTAKIKEQPNNGHLNRQLVLLGGASISTIHSFCLGVIREYFYEANVDPGFRVADVTETDLLKQEVLRELFGDCYEREDSSGFTRLAKFYGNSIKDDALQSLVLDIYEFAQSNPDPEGWLASQAESFNLDRDRDFYGGTVYGYFVEDTKEVLESALKNVDNALMLCRNPNIHEKYAEAISADREKIAAAAHALRKGFPDFYNAMGFDFERLTSVKVKTADGTMTDGEIKILKEEIKKYRDAAKSEIKKIQEKALLKPPEQMLRDIKNSYPVMKELVEVVTEFSRRYSAAKRGKNIADFSDLEHLCLKALRNRDIADEIRRKYNEVLIDEYQDINLVQETILEKVSRKSTGAPNRFMVGDIKQSIYRFRLANPNLFREKYNSYSRDEGAGERLVCLSKNFRSRGAVIDGINFLFRRLMSSELGEVTYDADAELYFGAEYYDGDAAGHKTEVCVIDTSASGADDSENDGAEDNGAENDENQDLLRDLTKYEVEAKVVASRIKELIGNFTVTDKDGDRRKARFSDIVILLRTQRLVADVFARELKSLDIPAFADSSGGYFEAAEIMTVLSFLQIIDNPRQDIALISVMYSPLFSFTADELVEIRRLGDGGLFYDCIAACAEAGEHSSPLRVKTINFLNTLNRWRDKAVYIEISSLLWEIYEDTGYYNYVGALAGGNVKQANLRALFERAVQYEKTSLKGLFHFVKYIEKLQKSKVEIGDAKVAGEGEDLVRIMSVHKSKGLEFPVVFVCGLGRRFNLQDAQKGFLMHQDLGFGSFYLDIERKIRSNTLPRYTIGKTIKRESLSEELRVLYVALTRAKEKLILVGSHGDPAAIAKKTGGLINMSSYLEWVLFALGKEDGSPLFDIYIKTRGEVDASERETAGRYAGIAGQLGQIDINTDYSGMKDTVYKKLSYVYPHLKAAAVPSKMSVSEIKRLYYQELLKDSEMLVADDTVRPQTFARPKFITGEKPPSQTEIGTIFHTVMEHLNFSAVRTTDDIKSFITELVNKNILTEENIKYVNAEAIYRFLNSDLAARIKRAENIWREAHFTISVSPSEINCDWEDISGEKIIVHGIIDCFFEENGGIVLVDYKTDNIKTEEVDEAAFKYRLQLELYKKAVEKNTGKKVIQSILYFFNKNIEKVL